MSPEASAVEILRRIIGPDPERADRYGYGAAANIMDDALRAEARAVLASAAPGPCPNREEHAALNPGDVCVGCGSVLTRESIGYSMKPARAARPTEAEIVTTLRNTLAALEAHLTTEAKARGVDVATLCPCWTVEVREARALLERLA